MSLEDLYARDGTPVPTLLSQCFVAIENFGLNIEGIYQIWGRGTHINQLKYAFETGEFNDISF